MAQKITLHKSKFVCVRFVYISDIFRVNENTVYMIILAHLGRFDDIDMSCAMCWGAGGISKNPVWSNP